ncbi:MAG: polysaccharide biosynthesis tyrosine autokinase [Sphingopyxis sp.]|nr:polysaccharide biosynthesis tyrosine autokinase [Sphingopyxis sp.]
MNNAALRRAREQQAVGLLLAHIAVEPVRGSALIDVKYSSASPRVSALVSNAWTQQFIVASMDRRFASTLDARRFLEGRLEELRVRLEKSERDAVNFAAEKGIVPINRNVDESGRTTVQSTLVGMDISLLNSELARATADRVAAESRLNNAGRGSTTEAINSATLASMRARRADAAGDYAKMLVQFEPNYPPARALKEQVDTLDRAISQEEGRIAGTRSGQYREALQRENELRAKVEGLKGRLNSQSRDSIQYNIYLREADTNRQLYESLLQRYKEIGVAGVAANNIAIVDVAQEPGSPSSPVLAINLALALLAGIGLAALATLALNQIDEGLRNPTDVNRALQLPLLGSVPDVGDESVLDELKDPKSATSEAYFSIQSNIAFSTDHGVPRSLMVTSTRPAEGKSTSSFAIATILARTGRRVLLIDADMRSPSLAGFVGLNNNRGLSNYLAGDDDWQQLVSPGGMGGAAYMVAGPNPPSAAELLSSERLTQLIRVLGDSYDHVVIDSPPILGLADAPLLSRAVEGVVFVVESDGVPVRGIRSALSRLHSAKARIFGVVLTKLSTRSAGYGYGCGYGYGYGSDETEEQKA